MQAQKRACGVYCAAIIPGDRRTHGGRIIQPMNITILFFFCVTIQMTVPFYYTGRVHHLNIAIDDIGCGCERDKSAQETHNSFNAFFYISP